MDKGYFNIILKKKEISFGRYVCNYIHKKDGRKGSKPLRMAKIMVHAIIKMKLNIRLFWYELGLLSVVLPQTPVTYSYESERNYIEEAIGVHPLKKLDSTIDEARGIYEVDFNSYEIRKKQYELLKDDLYLTQLEIENIIECNLFEKRSEFIKTLSKLLYHVPDNPNYDKLTQILNDFAVLANSLLFNCKKSNSISNNIVNSMNSILEYLDTLNAKYKKLKGFEELFTSDINPRDLKQKEWGSNSSLLVLKKDLSENITTESISWGSNNDINKILIQEFVSDLVI